MDACPTFFLYLLLPQNDPTRGAQGLDLHFVENEASGTTEGCTEDILPFPCMKSTTWPWL